jgi:hypothetical protein
MIGFVTSQTVWAEPAQNAIRSEGFYDPQMDLREESSKKLRQRFAVKGIDATAVLEFSIEESNDDLDFLPKQVLPVMNKEKRPVEAEHSAEFLFRRRRQFITDIIDVTTKLVELHGETSSIVYWSELKDIVHNVLVSFSGVRAEEVFAQSVATLELSTIRDGWEQYSPDKLILVGNLFKNMRQKPHLEMKDYLHYLKALHQKGISTLPHGKEEV